MCTIAANFPQRRLSVTLRPQNTDCTGVGKAAGLRCEVACNGRVGLARRRIAALDLLVVARRAKCLLVFCFAMLADQRDWTTTPET